MTSNLSHLPNTDSQGVADSTRNVALDAVCGVLIIHMVMGHAFQHAKLTDSWEYDLSRVLSFFMPWFFFKAGMFFKPKPAKAIAKGSWKRLMVPFIVFSIAGECVLLACNIYSEPQQWASHIFSSIKGAAAIAVYGSSPGNLALWFLLSLFIVKVVWGFLYNRRLVPVAFALMLIAPAAHLLGINKPLWLINSSAGLIWYCAGYYLRRVEIKNGWAIAALTLVWAVSIWFYPCMVDMHLNEVLAGNYFASYAQDLVGILAINALFAKLPFLQGPMFVHVGRNSMGYYCLHWIVLIAAGVMFPNMETRGYEYLFIAVAACVVLLPLLDYWVRTYLPYRLL